MTTIQNTFQPIISTIKNFPNQPGVYLFKDEQGVVVYIGKAKNLKKRGANYIQNFGADVKVDTIFASSETVEHQVTGSEYEALLLEATLIQSHQPKCNVLLKSGQPFVYIVITHGKIPELKIVRNQKKKGTYIGPFLEKSYARKVYNFLVKTFRLKLCKKNIENGCLFYHLGICAGGCRPDFDLADYVERLELAKHALQHGHKKFLVSLQKRISEHNAKLEFEKSRELHQYYEAFDKVFNILEQKPADIEHMARRDIWVATADGSMLLVFGEHESVIKKKRVFYFPFNQSLDQEIKTEYFLSFYRAFTPPATILVNWDIGYNINVLQSFLQAWHKKEYPVTISTAQYGHNAGLMRLAQLHAQQAQSKQITCARGLRQLLKLSKEPHVIDCFDVSHKQGMFMVGSCIRFVDGKPDKKSFRHFYIKTVEHQDDYASLHEIVTRRYKDKKDLPNLVVIDGGKGQLNAVIDIVPEVEFISLAKREETVFSPHLPAEGKKLDPKSYAGQLLIAIRDYAHHFAISFHRQVERKALHKLSHEDK